MPQKISSDINKILLVARHAPSSHNTQPWRVLISKEQLNIGFDQARQLKVGDPESHELLLSLGCFIETISIQAENLGYTSNITIGSKLNPKYIATITLTGKSNAKSSDYTENLILTRRSDRRMYENKHIDETVLRSLSNLSEPGANISIYNDHKDIIFLSEQTYHATFTAMSNLAFRSELSSWVRNNWTKKHDGMPAYTQGIPGPISLVAKFVIKKNKAVAKDQAKKDSNRVGHSAAIGIITVNKPNINDLVNAGRIYQRSCLLALKNGIKTSGVSAAVINTSTNNKIAKQLNLNGKPVALLRFGFTKNTPKSSPRLKLAEFTNS